MVTYITTTTGEYITTDELIYITTEDDTPVYDPVGDLVITTVNGEPILTEVNGKITIN